MRDGFNVCVVGAESGWKPAAQEAAQNVFVCVCLLYCFV